LPAETRLGLAPAPAESAADTQQAFVVTTGADGLAQVVSVDAQDVPQYGVPQYGPQCVLPAGSLPPKLLPAELTAPLKAHLQRLGYAATVSTITPTVQPHDATLPPQCSLITVSWK
jgi:hypothetical protein